MGAVQSVYLALLKQAWMAVCNWSVSKRCWLCHLTIVSVPCATALKPCHIRVSSVFRLHAQDRLQKSEPAPYQLMQHASSQNFGNGQHSCPYMRSRPLTGKLLLWQPRAFSINILARLDVWSDLRSPRHKCNRPWGFLGHAAQKRERERTGSSPTTTPTTKPPRSRHIRLLQLFSWSKTFDRLDMWILLLCCSFNTIFWPHTVHGSRQNLFSIHWLHCCCLEPVSAATCASAKSHSSLHGPHG